MKLIQKKYSANFSSGHVKSKFAEPAEKIDFDGRPSFVRAISKKEKLKNSIFVSNGEILFFSNGKNPEE